MTRRRVRRQAAVPDVRVLFRGKGCLRDGEALPIDLPSPCVMAHGIGGVREYQAFVNAPALAKSEVRVEPGRRTRVRKRLPLPARYRVPTMSEIAAVRGTNQLRVVSTFSGCGGSCLGFEMAGFEVVWANEFVAAARDTYALNHPGVILDGRDIREVKPSQILSATGLGVGELDVLEGSPPCASFSTAGKREQHWGRVKKYSDTSQRTDDLFFEYARLLRELQPRAFVAENVSGLVKGAAWGYFEEILRALRACGYRVKAKVLDAQWLGVPQCRKRLIFIGVREDLGVDAVHPEPLRARYSVRDALPHLASVVHDTSGAWGCGEVISRPSPTITVGVHSVNSLHFRVRDGSNCESGAAGMKAVPPRQFTISELQRLCGFPDDFRLTGSYVQQWERLGRSVPPVMMFHVARALRDHVLRPSSRSEAAPT